MAVLVILALSVLSLAIAKPAQGDMPLMRSDKHGHFHTNAPQQMALSAEESAAMQVIAEDSSVHTPSGIDAARARAPRRVYLDLGANWANTLRLFEDIGTKRAETPWEVYAFEASPFIQPYLEKFTAWLNGQGAKPSVTIPPSGSSAHLDEFAKRYGCPTCASQGCDAMRSCMFQRFRVPLSHLHPDQSLQSIDLIQSRLDTAKAASNGKNRFVAVPAAVGARSGKLELGVMTAEQMIRGGAHDHDDHAHGPTMTVPMVDFPKWLTQSFTKEDYVVVKMDIEGAEFPILNTLLDGPNGCIIDVLALECHSWGGDCPTLMQKLQQHPCISVITEDDTKSSGENMKYKGWDHHSSPDVYFAQDPRLA